MPDPTKYSRGYAFANYQANQPNKPLPGTNLDIELDNIADKLGEAVDAITEIRRTDGGLQNDIVTLDTLAPDVLAALGGLPGLTPLGMVSVQQFGARCDGVTNDAAAIQAAIDSVAVLGGGRVIFPAGVTVSGPLVLKTGVILEGQGQATELRLANGANADFIVSQNFATLTGQNKWLVADGVQHGLGLRNMRINGNKANQTAGIGVKFYAKRIMVSNVIIYDCFAQGWYSEAGDIPGQQGWQDLPEGHIDALWVRNCGTIGFQFRGPHDTLIGSLMTNENGTDGVRFEREPGVYSGACDVKFIHSYANANRGVYINPASQGRFHQVISEANFGEGLVCDGWFNQFGMVQTYNNCRSTGTWSLNIAGSHNIVRDYQHKDDGAGRSALRVRGIKNQVSCNIEGSASGGTGIDVAGALHRVIGAVQGYRGAGGRGLITGSGEQLRQSTIDVSVDDCATLWNNAQIGTNNTLKINGFATTGQVAFTGAGPNAEDVSENWDVRMSDQANNLYLSRIKKTSATDINLNTTAEQVITVPCTELLGLTPEPEDVQFSIYYTGTNTTWALQYARVSAITSSAVTFRVKLSTAAGAAETAKIITTVSLT